MLEVAVALAGRLPDAVAVQEGTNRAGMLVSPQLIVARVYYCSKSK